MSKARKLDIAHVLRAIDQRNFGWLDKQPEDARKEFAAVTAIRFVSAVRGDGAIAAYMLMMVNQRLNRHLFDLHKHPDLCFRLLASCGNGRVLRHEWLKGPERAASNNLALQLLAEQHPLANDHELLGLLSLYSRKQFADFLADCGITDKAAADHMKAYDRIAR